MVLHLRKSPYRAIDVYGELYWENLWKNWGAEVNSKLYQKLLFKKLVVIYKIILVFLFIQVFFEKFIQVGSDYKWFSLLLRILDGVARSLRRKVQREVSWYDEK